MDIVLPFKVGDLAESRSFSLGFRGAWFSCKICDMCTRHGHLECLLEYIDFPDEKKTWTRLYKLPSGFGKRKSSRMLILRPMFPKWYWENEKPEPLPKTDDVAIVSSPWKVGDLIEWWYTNCYWTGKIIELLGNDRVKVALHEQPFGEGGYYDADCKDLRPALDWSLETGWSVPLSQENGNSWYTARLITHNTESSSSEEDVEQFVAGKEEVQSSLNGSSNTPVESMDCAAILVSTNEQDFINTPGDSKGGPQKCSNGASEIHQEVNNSEVELPPNETGKDCIASETDCANGRQGESPDVLSDGESSPAHFKRQKTSSEHASFKVLPGTVDDAILELEKVGNRIRQLEKHLLLAGSAPMNETKPSWKIWEKDGSAKH